MLTFPQPDREIAGCINDIGIPFTAADLAKPNPQQIQMVFEWFAELLMNVTRETVEPAMHAAAEDTCGDYPDIVPNDTRNLMGFFISVRRLLMEVLGYYHWKLYWILELIFSVFTIVRRERLYLHRLDETDSRPTRQDLLLPHQLRALPRVANTYH